MKDLDVVGFKLEEGLQIIRSNTNRDINILKTQGFKKEEIKNLIEPRILKVITKDDRIDVIIGYF